MSLRCHSVHGNSLSLSFSWLGLFCLLVCTFRFNCPTALFSSFTFFMSIDIDLFHFFLLRFAILHITHVLLVYTAFISLVLFYCLCFPQLSLYRSLALLFLLSRCGQLVVNSFGNALRSVFCFCVSVCGCFYSLLFVHFHYHNLGSSRSFRTAMFAFAFILVQVPAPQYSRQRFLVIFLFSRLFSFFLWGRLSGFLGGF